MKGAFSVEFNPRVLAHHTNEALYSIFYINTLHAPTKQEKKSCKYTCGVNSIIMRNEIKDHFQLKLLTLIAS